jgi:hypothetical protein
MTSKDRMQVFRLRCCGASLGKTLGGGDFSSRR